MFVCSDVFVITDVYRCLPYLSGLCIDVREAGGSANVVFSGGRRTRVRVAVLVVRNHLLWEKTETVSIIQYDCIKKNT